MHIVTMNWWIGRFRFIIAVFCILCKVKADYHIGFVGPTQFNNPTNQLANGTCCNLSCSDECSVTLRYCFRDAGHSQNDTNSSCLLSVVNRANPGQFTSTGLGQTIQALFSGSFQVYIRVSHQTGDSPDFDPPFTDPLIDNIFIEVENLPVGNFDDVVLTPVQYSATGVFGRASIELRINARCAEGFNGSDCSTFCQEVEGQQMCEQVDLPASPTSTPIITTPSEVPINPGDGDSDNVLAIAVGASVGGVVALALLVAVISAIVICTRRKKRKGSYKPGNIHYSLPSKSDPRSAPPSEIELKSRPRDSVFDSFSSESNSSPPAYSIVNKSAPPIPPYELEDSNEYQLDNPTKPDSSHVYQNTASVHHNVDSENEANQDGLVYADLDMQRKMTHGSEERNGVRKSVPQANDDDTGTPEADEVTYTAVQNANQ